MQHNRWYGRDVSLQFRMAFTMLLLTVLYLIFGFVLFRYTHIASLIFILPLGLLFFQYFFSDKIVLHSVGARIVDASQAPRLHDIVQRLAQQADMPMPKLAMLSSQMPNAFATGRSPKHAVIAVTSGLMSQLSGPEVEAVIAHEMTHIRNRDMIVMTMASSFAAVATYIVQMGFWFGLGGRNDRNGNNPFGVILIVSVVVALISHMLVLALSRYREYAADRGSAILTGQPEHLESALLRITGTIQRIPSQDLREAQPMSAMFIAAPSKESVMEIFSDHPSVQKRIARLQRFQSQMSGR
ncbi:MAG: zinc metalloprotease HtpX [Chloroflexota bacterium]